MSPTSGKSYTRWLIKRDLPAIIDIENASFPYPWTEEEFLDVLKQRNSVGFVFEEKETIIGYVLVQLNKDSCEIINFAVAEDRRKQGIGAKMLTDIIVRYANKRSVFAVISDINLGAHLFFSRMNFYATQVLKNYFDVGHDAYEFVYEGDN